MKVAAIQAVKNAMWSKKLLILPNGQDMDARENIIMATRGKYDRCSLMLYRQPEWVVEVPAVRTFMVDIVTLWHIEALHLRGIAEWDAGQDTVMVVVFDPSDHQLYAAWPRQMRIEHIYMPPVRGADVDKIVSGMFKDIPQTVDREMKCSVPIVPLRRSNFLPLQEFIDKMILAPNSSG